MDQINELLDRLYFTIIAPFVSGLGSLLESVLITPFSKLHPPVLLQIILLALFLAVFSFTMRRILKVEHKTRAFNKRFAAKREKQQNLQLISDKYSRNALYRVTDEELNDEYNSFLASHYARYVSIYLLPLFLVLAWINTVFTPEYLQKYHDSPFVVQVSLTGLGIEGFNVTFCFLVAYICWLIIGFQSKKLFGK